MYSSTEYPQRDVNPLKMLLWIFIGGRGILIVNVSKRENKSTILKRSSIVQNTSFSQKIIKVAEINVFVVLLWTEGKERIVQESVQMTYNTHFRNVLLATEKAPFSYEMD